MGEPRPKGRISGDEVAGLREALGISQAELAARLGVRQQTVSDWETSTHAPQGAARRMLSMVAEEAAEYRTGLNPKHEET